MELNRDLWLLLAIGFAMVVSIQLLLPLFPLFLDSHGASEMEISFVISLSSLASTALMIPAGFMMERVGKKRMILIGLLIWTVTPVFIGSAMNWRIAAPLYMVYNLADAFVSPARMTMITEYATPESQATVFGFMSMDWPVGGCISPPLSGFLLRSQGGTSPFRSQRSSWLLAWC
jgi:MFS family permease